MARAKGFYIKSDLTNELKKAASDISRYGAGAQQRMRSAILLEKGVKPSVVVPTKKMALKFNGNFAKWANLPARKARPFMKPALDEVEPKVIKALKEAVEP